MSGSDRVSSRPSVNRVVGRTSQCSTCNGPVDPLRAARVRIIDDQFHYFCTATCANSFSLGPAEVEGTRPSTSEATNDESGEPQHSVQQRHTEPGPTKLNADPGLVISAADQTPLSPSAVAREHTPVSPSAPVQQRPDAPARRSSLHTPVVAAQLALDASRQRQAVERTRALTAGRLLTASMATAGLSILLLLALEGDVTNWLRALLLDASFGCLLIYALKTPRRPEAAWGVGTVASFSIALVVQGAAHLALAFEPGAAPGWLGLAGTQLGYLGFVLFTLERKCVPLDEARLEIARAFDGSVLRLSGSETTRVAVAELRPGEEIVSPCRRSIARRRVDHRGLC